MLSSFPSAWLVLGLPFASAAVIAHVPPLRGLSARCHRITWPLGVLGLCAFSAALVGLLPEAWTMAAVLLGGAAAGFACFWTRSTDDDGGGGEGPDVPIDWREFDRRRAQWERRPKVKR